LGNKPTFASDIVAVAKDAVEDAVRSFNRDRVEERFALGRVDGKREVADEMLVLP
jgi:hypothetical protein